MSSKPTELDANRLMDSQMPEHYRDHMERVLGRKGCNGMSCLQGRAPCKDRCSAEMACHAAEDLKESFLSKFARWIRGIK